MKILFCMCFFLVALKYDFLKIMTEFLPHTSPTLLLGTLILNPSPQKQTRGGGRGVFPVDKGEIKSPEGWGVDLPRRVDPGIPPSEAGGIGEDYGSGPGRGI